MIRTAQQLAIRVINERGVALYNSGDLKGCAQTYANTIIDIVSIEGIPDRPKKHLSRALQEASRLSDDTDAQAWALRGALYRFIEYEPGSDVLANLGNARKTSLLLFDEGMPAKFYSIIL